MRTDAHLTPPLKVDPPVVPAGLTGVQLPGCEKEMNLVLPTHVLLSIIEWRIPYLCGHEINRLEALRSRL